MSWFDKIKTGLTKSSSQLNQGITNIFLKKKLDNETLDGLEELLILSDIGTQASSKIIKQLAKEKFDKDITLEEIKQFLACKIAEILNESKIDNLLIPNQTNVILVCGVNGNGKTTSIGKLAHYFKNQGKSVLFAACDTFRAAATEQLTIWAERNNCEIVSGPPQSDPASLAYQALKLAYDKQIDVLLIDTAGRIQTKTELMDELAKISRVLKKLDSNAPHHTILTLDATTGQNAYSQLEKFKESANISSLIITKLDGTAKAGVVVGLYDKYKIPIFAVGIGEKIDDLEPFNPLTFANNLLGI